MASLLGLPPATRGAMRSARAAAACVVLRGHGRLPGGTEVAGLDRLPALAVACPRLSPVPGPGVRWPGACLHVVLRAHPRGLGLAGKFQPPRTESVALPAARVAHSRSGPARQGLAALGWNRPAGCRPGLPGSCCPVP